MFKHWITTGVIAVLGWTIGLPAQAEIPTIPGAGDPRFVEARQQWLEGDDLAALEALALLARDDVVAAQILLSRIARTPHILQPITENLTRRERIALLREEVGLSGRDWMESAAESSPLAAAFWEAVDRDVFEGRNPEMVNILIAHGEVREAIRFLSYLISEVQDRSVIPLIYAHSEELGYAVFPVLDFALRGEIQRGAETIPMPRPDMTRDDVISFIENLSAPQGQLAAYGVLTLMDGQDYSVDEQDLSRWIGEAPELQPLSGFCARVCPASTNACLISTTRALTFGIGFPHPLASPSQALISDNFYRESARFERDLLTFLAAGQWSGCEP